MPDMDHHLRVLIGDLVMSVAQKQAALDDAATALAAQARQIADLQAQVRGLEEHADYLQGKVSALEERT